MEPAKPPLAEETVEGNIDVDDDHAALRFQQVYVVDHFGTPTIHV